MSDNDASANQSETTAENGGQVLRMVDFNPEQPARILSDLRDYWQSLRQGRAIPARSDVEPRGIRTALDHAFILERIAPGAARFRLAGRHLIDLMGMEVRGMPVCSFLNPASRGRLSDVLETVFKAPQIAELRLSGPADYGRPAMTGRMLLLPLRSDLGDVTRALGCLIAEGEVGMTPRRFDLVGERVSPVIDGAEVMVPSPSARGFADDAAPWRKPVATAPALPETPEERRARFRVIGHDD
ncbi:MAG: PAS domain-containing protein [Paracoccus sp. (in: a-proteobacteria)]|nr:PAS domain-containing protein [Paracoccus sp. (in: a-proteobacteria)]